jgi:MinD superfamily P-loop ATPase
MATNKIKRTITTNRSQTAHKRYKHNLNQIKNILQKDNLTVTKADKNKAIVIINKTMLEQKIETFIQEMGITTLPKDPTDQFHKQIQHAILRCQTIIERKQQKFLLHINPFPSTVAAALTA